ncbi:hypothetical protein BLOT_002924 [Blomia tropicalis]|nr:hypothetical protein BLOT_002924 [Blomia tropicalis]
MKGYFRSNNPIHNGHYRQCPSPKILKGVNCLMFHKISSMTSMFNIFENVEMKTQDFLFENQQRTSHIQSSIESCVC